MVNLKRNEINDNLKPSTEAYASVISPTIASLTAKLEALELHSLIPGNGSNDKIENNSTQVPIIKSLLSDNEFKSFVKNIVQEVHNEKVSTYIPYKNNRKSFYNNENYNNNNDQSFKNYPFYAKNNYNRNNNSNTTNENGNSYYQQHQQHEQ